MLALGRTKGRRVVCTVPPSDKPTEIWVTVLRDGSVPRLGFEAPEHVSIQREEVHERILRERELEHDMEPLRDLEAV